MTHEEVLMHEPVQINSLYSLNNISDYYYLIGYDVVNITTGKKKAINRMWHGKHYPYVTLTEKGSNKRKKVTFHKILALAYINNGPYELIEHLDDNPENFRIDNLIFSTQSSNLKRSFINGHGNRIDKIFTVVMNTGEQYTGTMKELSQELGIPRQTIYGRYYLGTPGKDIQSVTLITG